MDRQHSSDSTPENSPSSPDRGSAAASGPATNASTYAELSAVVLDHQPLGAVLRRIADLAVKTIPGVEDASVTLIENGQARTVAFSGQLAVTLDERQYADGFGPCIDAARYGQTIVVDTHDESGVYPDFARQARRRGIRHVLSVGMPALQKTSGGVNIYGPEGPGPFGETVVDLATTFAGHAGVTLFNAALYAGARDEVAQMKQAMASRAQIEQAKGIIMAERGCNAEEAFAVLVDVSSRSNRKVRDVAETVIKKAASGIANGGQPWDGDDD
jgi:GAF domain-containing protein